MPDTEETVIDCTVNVAPATAIHTAFRSGMSALNDMKGCITSNMPLGVVAGLLNSGQQLFTLPKYLKSGGTVFIDSGAFNAVRSGEEPDFNAVLKVYETIVDMTWDDDEASRTALLRLYVVAPDMVGDQERTLALLAQYKARVLALIDMGCKVIVAIQQGDMRAKDMLDAIKDVLGTDQFVAGIPSCAKPMSVEECATIDHHSAHILGRVVKDADQLARIAALSKHNPNIILTADACWLRSRIPVLGPESDRIRTARRGEYNIAMPHARTAAIAQLLITDTEWAA